VSCSLDGRTRKVLFTPELLDLLNVARFDPCAQRCYDGLSDSFHWTDEFPRGFIAETTRQDNWSFRGLLSYRASLTRGRPDARFQPTWYQVLRACPDWPGFRFERRAKQLADLLDTEHERFLAEFKALLD
jgi:hypothetical protein